MVDELANDIMCQRFFKALYAKKLNRLVLQPYRCDVRKFITEEILKQCPNLKVLAIISPRLFTEKSFAEIAESYQQITEFQYTVNKPITFNANEKKELEALIDNFMYKFKNLQYADVVCNSKQEFVSFVNYFEELCKTKNPPWRCCKY